jgi:hypothetical protein
MSNRFAVDPKPALRTDAADFKPNSLVFPVIQNLA